MCWMVYCVLNVDGQKERRTHDTLTLTLLLCCTVPGTRYSSSIYRAYNRYDTPNTIAAATIKHCNASKQYYIPVLHLYCCFLLYLLPRAAVVVPLAGHLPTTYQV